MNLPPRLPERGAEVHSSRVMAGKDFLRETVEAPESPIDVSLRPPLLAEFAGLDRVVERLQLMVDAARQRSDVLQHVLLSGPPGLGK
ncbi:MAG: hypothetical protein ACKOEI_02685, partial [Chthoniobacterales bacterium]